jgi:hypothetical protein
MRQSTPADALTLAAMVSRLFHGVPSMVVGAALAELLSAWLAQHPPELVRELLANHLRAVDKLERENRAIFQRNLSTGASHGSKSKPH